jgi:hypothetical protein
MYRKNIPHGDNNRVTLSRDYNAIMWISSRNLSAREEVRVINLIKSGLEKESKNLIFYGHCFGRYDLIVEFIDQSAKVASWCVCDLQERIENQSRIKVKGRGFKRLLCSSLTLCNALQSTYYKVNHKLNDSPIRIYTFLKPKMGEISYSELLTITQELDRTYKSSVTQLFWNPSSYAFLLVTYGDFFNQMFAKILEFRRRSEEFFSESCTYVGLGLGLEDKNEDVIEALVFIKLRRGFGEIDIDITTTNYTATLSGPLLKRLGWFDLCIPLKRRTLREIKDFVLKLRERHQMDIVTTSTLLLPKEAK